MASDALIGVVLDGRYRIEEPIGEGGSGRVYRAEQVRAAGRAVAIKVLHAAGGARPALARRFENEARIIAGLRHPNTIRLFDTGRLDDGRLYLVTEFLEGETLSDRVEARGPMGSRETLVILEQIAGSLVEAHESGVVHRDLKPANVFLEKVGSQEVVKVLDFGIAKLVDGARITAPDQIFGTPAYMSPEQCSAGPVDGRSDLYSLGAIAYNCLTDRHPAEGNSLVEVLRATIEQEPPSLRSYENLAPLHPEFEGLVMQLLAKHPGDLLPDAESVRTILNRLLKHHDETDPVPLPGTLNPRSIPNDITDPLTMPPTAFDPTNPVAVPEVHFSEDVSADIPEKKAEPEPDAEAGDFPTRILSQTDLKQTEVAQEQGKLHSGSDISRNLLLGLVSALLSAAAAALYLWSR